MSLPIGHRRNFETLRHNRLEVCTNLKGIVPAGDEPSPYASAARINEAISRIGSALSKILRRFLRPENLDTSASASLAVVFLLQMR